MAIEEVYRDAKLEVKIQAVGFGLGVAKVVAGSDPYLIKQNSPMKCSTDDRELKLFGIYCKSSQQSFRRNKSQLLLGIETTSSRKRQNTN